MKPEKRIELDKNQRIVSQYRKIKENFEQIQTLIDNIERAIDIIDEESSLETIFDQEELEKISDVRDKMTHLKKVKKVKVEDENNA